MAIPFVGIPPPREPLTERGDRVTWIWWRFLEAIAKNANAILPPSFGTAATKNASNNASPVVSSVSGSTTPGDVAVFADAFGSIHDGGLLGTAAHKLATDNAQPDVASVFGAIAPGHIAVFRDTQGTIEDGGAAATLDELLQFIPPADPVPTSVKIDTGQLVNEVLSLLPPPDPSSFFFLIPCRRVRWS